MTVQFNENNDYQPPIDYLDTTFDFYCGFLIVANEGYCNYIEDSLEVFGTPTDNNYKEWYMLRDFFEQSEKAKIVRPIPTTTIGNHELQFSGSIDPVVLGIKNCYNPTVATITLETYSPEVTLSVIAKDVALYNSTSNYAYAICSSTANFTKSIFSDSDLTIFDDSLINDSDELKTFNELTDGTPDFSNDEFVIVELYKISTTDWKVKGAFIVSYDSDSEKYVDDQTFYSAYIIKGSISTVVETYSMTLSHCIYQAYSATGISTTDFTLEQSDYEAALNVLKADTSIKGIISFEYSSAMNLVASVFTTEDVLLFVGTYDNTRYSSEDDKNGKILDDFKENNVGSYFTSHRNNTVIVTNMYREYDEYNEEYRWIPYMGEYAGKVWANEMINPIQFEEAAISNKKLMYKPTDVERAILLDNQMNLIMNRKGQNYLFGNKIVHNSLVIKDIFNAAIIEQLRYRLNAIKTAFTSAITNKNAHIKREQIYNQIHLLLVKYYTYISNNSITFDEQTETLIFTITIWLKNVVDNFVVNIDLTYSDIR